MRAIGWAAAVVLALAGEVGVRAIQDRVYLVPQRPECEPLTWRGQSLRLAVLFPAMAMADESIVPPWQPLQSAPADDPIALIDLARCYYTFDRGLPDAPHRDDVDKTLDAAMAAAKRRAAAAPAPRARSSLPRAGRDVPEPVKTHDEPPRYPPEAVRAQAIGIVFLEAAIDRSGNVREARVIGSIPALDREAARVVRRWKFQPTVLDGKRVEIAKLVTVKFGPDPSPSPTDGMDIARFHAARGDFAVAHGALEATRRLLQSERATARPVTLRVDELRRARVCDDKAEGLRLPVPVARLQPKYTSAAMKEKIQGEVQMRVAILSDGTIGAVRVVKSLDAAFGLDAQAVEAAGAWRFTPALDATGTAVPCVVTLVMEFRLH